MTAQPAAPLIDIESLFVRFEGAPQPRVNGISLTLQRGECLALVGESGSGKSVTARTIIGLPGRGAHVEARRLQLGGEDILSLSERRWADIRGNRVGFVMQDALGSLDPLLTVGAEVGEPLRLHTRLTRAQRTEKVIELLRSVGVPEPELRVRQHPRQLSGGQRQRALIASAIACDPELLIADEPTTALDAAVQAQVVALLERLRRPDAGMLIVSHDLAVVAHLADRIAVMQQGSIVEIGRAAEILNAPRHPYTCELLEAAKAIHGSKRSPARVVPLRPVAEAPLRPPVIAAHAVSKSFTGPDRKNRTAVNEVSFALQPGETLGIVGESGSGKTTLTRLILGLEQPDSGTIALRGRPWSDLRGAELRAERKRIQVVFQDPLASFDPRYTVGRVLDEALAITGGRTAAQRRSAARELLDLVRLDPAIVDRRPIELSGGQRQRVAIARALAPEPDVLLCDEPVSALDVYVQAQILELLADLKTRLSLSCIFISHDLGVIHRISDRVLVMHQGRVVESGSARDIFEAPQHAYTQALVASILPVDGRRRANHG